MYDKLNQANLIGILSQSFDIFVPNDEILRAQLIKDADINRAEILRLYLQQDKVDSATIRDLIETKEDRNQSENDKRNLFDETTRLD